MFVSVAVGLGLYWLVMLVVSGNYNASKVLDPCFYWHRNNWVAESIRNFGFLIRIGCCSRYCEVALVVVVSYCCHSCLSLDSMMLLSLAENFGFDCRCDFVVSAVSAVVGCCCYFDADYFGFELEWLLLVF